MQWFNIGMMGSNLTAEDLKKKLKFFIRKFIWLWHNNFLKGELKIEDRLFRPITLYRIQS